MEHVTLKDSVNPPGKVPSVVPETLNVTWNILVGNHRWFTLKPAHFYYNKLGCFYNVQHKKNYQLCGKTSPVRFIEFWWFLVVGKATKKFSEKVKQFGNMDKTRSRTAFIFDYNFLIQGAAVLRYILLKRFKNDWSKKHRKILAKNQSFLQMRFPKKQQILNF